ncbi:hypothetical protein BYT27DRAFT_7190682 [Phlegmacium glaucopus]|nr:hypothetical protein BYT27DRAFT_7190682 [Phlegmacium glaucopus]
MNTFLTPFFLFSFLASTVFAQLTINSLANVVQCQPSLISWSGGILPYFLSILPANQPNAAALVNLGLQNGTSFTWVANLTAGVSGFLELRDSTGAIGQSGSFTVLTSSDSSCLSSTSGAAPATTSTSAGTGAATGTVPGATSATSPASGTTPARSSAAATTGGTTASSSTGASQPKSSSGAVASHYAPVGTLAMIGAAFALVL